ncbi:monocarboxylate transporter 13-like isoform X3 [Ptychodera flava]|uniref:monocarboxylate transporter 13-like isoform X3 n=1 Tax=Ptychodera flava TaxID=63121 RepID=UPI00396A4564
MEAAIGDHPDGGWGWVIVFASFLGFFISAGLLNSFSVIYVAFLDAFKESKAVTAWISGIFDVAFTFSASYGVAFSKRFGHRKAVMAAGVLASLGILTSGFTTHVYQLFFTYGVLTGAGMGVVYVTCIEIVSIYFKKRFPIAIGLASAGAGAAQVILLAIYGTCSGGYFVFRAIVIKHFLGDEKVGQATSLLIQVLGIISFFAAPLGGWMRDSSGIYDGFFWLSGSWLLLASVLAAFLPMINRLGKLKCRQGKSKAEDNDVETKSESTDSILSTP